ncbi:uracil phosphoribosyltransferase [Sulfurovum sp. XTW-4]|uniref:Uracil phosphoribosyltransferase n=1 Tax=Sulfurovum xiamenensis TaxID=3019066 RepID=A0ABT7QRY5_9BACT|nr:uracil phosphoribosyltransferase [Sulfurovum xiamenensis]MDM5263314.1 uracil phosphoribosyltransferase [Sulfurovum xiamenensis]
MIYELSNPVAKTLLNHLREKKSDALRFRHIVQELSRLLVYEALKNETLYDQTVTTWQGEETFGFIKEEDIIFVTILRAGLPMIESVTALFPNASSGFLAMKRDENTHQSILYYDRIPECEGKTVIIVDPMVATAGSLCDAISVIEGKSPKKIISLNIIGSPEGMAVLKQKHPNVEVFIAHIDKKLNEYKFIIPGLGDAGDRSYNTMD